MRQSWWIIALVLLLLVGGGTVVYTMTRGLRNNNPGNIREGENDTTLWQGERATDDDPAFEEFKTPVDGLRAMAVLINNYRRLYGRNTIRKIVTRWAPANENDLVAYIASVSDYTGLGPDQQLTDANLPVLIAAIIKHENGVMPYSYDMIAQGIALA